MENHKRPMRGPMGHRGMRGGEKALSLIHI